MSTTCCAAASGAMITTGLPEPPGKWSLSACWPAMESTSVRNTSVCAVPEAFRVGTKAQATASPIAVIAQIRRG